VVYAASSLVLITGHVLLYATVPSTVGDTPTLQLLGNPGGTAATIMDAHTGAVAASVSYRYWGGLGRNREEYYATVAAGVDLSVVVALCLAWDLGKEDDTNGVFARGGGG
jgi:hypothetical protein